MSGVDFVLNIVMHTLPSEAVLIHVFDINTRQFIVVRALGPSPHAVILHRTPDQDDLFRRAMRVTRATRVANASGDPNYANGRWELLGVGVNVAMLGPVQLAGRFLGAIELVNPLGGEPYSEHESHALDYICEQFAEFLAARPIVVDADVVLGKG
jgi:GAF domain-containing protein